MIGEDRALRVPEPLQNLTCDLACAVGYLLLSYLWTARQEFIRPLLELSGLQNQAFLAPYFLAIVLWGGLVRAGRQGWLNSLGGSRWKIEVFHRAGDLVVVYVWAFVNFLYFEP